MVARIGKWMTIVGVLICAGAIPIFVTDQPYQRAPIEDVIIGPFLAGLTSVMIGPAMWSRAWKPAARGITVSFYLVVGFGIVLFLLSNPHDAGITAIIFALFWAIPCTISIGKFPQSSGGRTPRNHPE